MKTCVIIAAGGKSSRMNGVDKQLFSLCGIPVLIRSIMAFDRIECISQIIVVAADDRINETIELISLYHFSHDILVTSGGATRQQSVFNGFFHVHDDCELIAIHDGARPLVTENAIYDVFESAEEYGAAALGVALKDTVKRIDGGFIKATPDRSRLVSVQTPQVFKKELFIKGMDNAIEKNLDFTDDCQLVEAVGARVFITNGDYSNIKITTPQDLKIAELLLTEEEYENRKRL